MFSRNHCGEVDTMNILLLGVGMQGKAALHDLWQNPAVTGIVAADRDFDPLRQYVQRQNYGPKVRAAYADAEVPDSLQKLLAAKPTVVVDLTPSRCSPLVAREALRARVHLVNTVYVLPAMKELAAEIEAAGLTFLPEFGMDPGIDLVLLGQAVSLFDRVETIDS
jgi:saccharopine dehydrogenase-like NADP-dependent oxidoreductase